MGDRTALYSRLLPRKEERKDMKYSSMLVLGMCVVGLVSVVPVQDASAQGGWTTLFDGSNLDSFNPIGDAYWEIADGAVGAVAVALAGCPARLSHDGSWPTGQAELRW